ncbi:hemolysin family protein [Rathayibacter toxicus]|uniref:HlyC/CorC family transporter n=1 Tax=Rathayibacter toxicus TaxID=145458 RepID=A0A2S5Y6S7_9MICO|nr:hemolysin family protein [Rathayibacter toxicus]PPH23629.1 HlyC/CorC family transporter [Rathayibacter toxicus]PPH57434.1 HlyC/CorC family transporter [Rathayibacter toxicus]PPH59934.1 HlyC/CorC family transporter [Rathayibacter toxicus]PPH87390.1 HlyC/CorC family transporter [Rathayibacter toxicus]PPI15157.1 HlyC/CorC family transporter [Rathayibacter toxicus]
MPTLQFLLAALALVAVGGLFAATDAALSVFSRTDLLELAQHSRSARSLRAIAADMSAHVTVINFSRIVAETTAAVFVAAVLMVTIDELWLALLLAILIMAAVSFVLVGSSPRSVGRAHARAVLTASALPVHVLRVALGPVAHGLVALGNRVTPGAGNSAGFSSEEQLLSMVDEATEQAVLEHDDRELIHSIFEFNDTLVREVMVPRTDMVTIEATASVGAGMGLLLSRGVSRLPVTGDGVDDVLGMLYLRDVARHIYERPDGDDTVAALVRPALFVPESQKADQLLRQMQLKSNHLAMVVDEYGGIAGLVTLEDLIEELVGDISDEYDREAELFEEIAPGVYRVSARLTVDQLGELVEIDLADDDVDSVGGLLTKVYGRLPERGASARINGVVLEAEQANPRRGTISTVIVRRDPGLPSTQESGVDLSVLSSDGGAIPGSSVTAARSASGLQNVDRENPGMQQASPQAAEAQDMHAQDEDPR